MPFAIELENLSKFYHKKGQIFRAVDNLNLKVERGTVIGFLGPNGAGKTTTIKMVCNLITPTSGTIKLNGIAINTHKEAAISQLGAVLEGTRNIYWQLSALNNLIYFGKLKGISGNNLYKRTEKLLKELDLWHRKDDSVSEFSRGMQQKVAIACALIADPPIILLDEPTLGLDVQASRTIKQWIENLAINEKKTIVLTTHQLDTAEQLCDRIVIINKGKIIADKPKPQMLMILQQQQYRIIVLGRINNANLLIPDMMVSQEDQQTIFTGAIVDHNELYNKLSLLKEHKLELVSVTKLNDKLEEIFVHLMQKQDLAT